MYRTRRTMLEPGHNGDPLRNGFGEQHHSLGRPEADGGTHLHRRLRVGYSSLSYLKRLPADTLKIDKSFVAGLGEDVQDTAIVRMLVDLAHTLGMKIVAEGVESEEQAEQLNEMGCDLAQGFYFAEPLPVEEATGFLSR
jgi:predicted signal transduction protein with EAL and GGDEF domain